MVETKYTRAVGSDLLVLQGIEQVLAETSSLTLGGRNFTPVELAAFVHDRLTAAERVHSLQAELTAARHVFMERTRECEPVLRDLRAVIQAQFGPGSTQARAFGFKPPKARRPMTLDEQVAAIRKRAATRKARGTMGRKQKLAIVGSAPKS